MFEHEEAIVKAFVVRERRERLLSFATSSKNRKKFTNELAHFRWFDMRYATPVNWSVDPSLKLWDRHSQGLDNLVRLLKSKGAGATCWVVSENTHVDGKEMTLEAALKSTIGSGMGTILSLVPGKLAYFEGEDEALLLVRQ